MPEEINDWSTPPFAQAINPARLRRPFNINDDALVELAQRIMGRDDVPLGDLTMRKEKVKPEAIVDVGSTTVQLNNRLMPVPAWKDVRIEPVDFPYDHPVGIEIEVENCTLNLEEDDLNRGLTLHNDGSLRNGIEFVTRFGVTTRYALAYLKGLHDRFEKDTVTRHNNFSFRCGLHVHLDVGAHTMRDLYKVFLTYCVVEPLLFAVSGGRNSNKFCVAAVHSASTMDHLLHYGHTEEWENFRQTLRAGNKYMAMNYRPLRRHGTLEFRHHEGTSDPNVIAKWLLILCDLVLFSKTVDVKQLEEKITSLNTISAYEGFIIEHFPYSAHLFLSVPNVNKLMYPGVAYIKQSFVCSPLVNESFLNGEHD